MTKATKKPSVLDIQTEFCGTTKGNINDYIGQRYEADEDVYVKTLIPNLPSKLQSDVKRHICLHSVCFEINIF